MPAAPPPVSHTFALIPPTAMVRPTFGLATGLFPTISLCNHALRCFPRWPAAMGTAALPPCQAGFRGVADPTS